MKFAKQVLGVAFAATSAVFSVGVAQAETAEVYDGLTFAQFKTILTGTKLTLSEAATPKGNRYFVVTIPGLPAPFVATTQDCNAGQDAACEGFTYFYIEEKNVMDAAAMSQFNVDYPFVKAMPSADRTHTIIQGEFYARGGVPEKHVTMSGAYFTAALMVYLKKSVPTAMNGAPPLQGLAMTRPAQADRFFADLAARSAGQPVMTGPLSPSALALIDAANAPRH